MKHFFIHCETLDRHVPLLWLYMMYRWLIDWLIVCLIDRLIDWVYEWSHYLSKKIFDNLYNADYLERPPLSRKNGLPRETVFLSRDFMDANSWREYSQMQNGLSRQGGLSRWVSWRTSFTVPQYTSLFGSFSFVENIMVTGMVSTAMLRDLNFLFEVQCCHFINMAVLAQKFRTIIPKMDRKRLRFFLFRFIWSLN